MTIAVVKRMKFYSGNTTEFCIKGRYVEADDQDVHIVAGLVTTAWWEVPLPPCPDCGGNLVWLEAGYVPGTRRCMGTPNENGSYDLDGGCWSFFTVETE